MFRKYKREIEPIFQQKVTSDKKKEKHVKRLNVSCRFYDLNELLYFATVNLFSFKSSFMISHDRFPKRCLFLLKQHAPNCSVTQLMVTKNYTRNPTRLYFINNEIHEGFVRITFIPFYNF